MPLELGLGLLSCCGVGVKLNAIQRHPRDRCVRMQNIGVAEQGIKLLGLLLTGSTGQHMASRNGLA